MFTNIGKKIKALTLIIFWIVAFSTFIAGLCLVSEGVEFGFAVMFAVPIAAWIGSFLLYGYGELIDNIQVQTRQNNEIIKLMGGTPIDAPGSNGAEMNVQIPNPATYGNSNIHLQNIVTPEARKILIQNNNNEIKAMDIPVQDKKWTGMEIKLWI